VLSSEGNDVRLLLLEGAPWRTNVAANSDVGIPYPLTAAERVQPISSSALDGGESNPRKHITIALIYLVTPS
jgi:hypothetical protein